MNLLALHGFLGSSQDFTGLNETLGFKNFWAPDLFGKDHDLLDTDFKTTASKILDELDDRFGKEPLHLMGYSLGGRIALHLALFFPERFQQVILLSTHPGIFDKDEIQDRRKWENMWLERLKDSSLMDFAEKWQEQEIFRHDTPLNTNLDGLDRAALGKAFLNFSNTNHQFSYSELISFKKSLIWVCGEKDSKFIRIMEQIQKQRGDRDHFVTLSARGHRLIAGEDWSWLCELF